MLNNITISVINILKKSSQQIGGMSSSTAVEARNSFTEEMEMWKSSVADHIIRTTFKEDFILGNSVLGDPNRRNSKFQLLVLKLGRNSSIISELHAASSRADFEVWLHALTHVYRCFNILLFAHFLWLLRTIVLVVDLFRSSSDLNTFLVLFRLCMKGVMAEAMRVMRSF